MAESASLTLELRRAGDIQGVLGMLQTATKLPTAACNVRMEFAAALLVGWIDARNNDGANSSTPRHTGASADGAAPKLDASEARQLSSKALALIADVLSGEEIQANILPL